MGRRNLSYRKAAVLVRLDIAGLVAELFDRRIPAGFNQLLVCCPVHDEEHPSCSINTETGLFNCKACGAAGNVFDLNMAARGVDFATALQDLELRAGITSPPCGRSARNRPTPHPVPKAVSSVKPAASAKPKPASRNKGKVVAVYRYLDAHGNFHYQKSRIEPGPDGRKKGFRFDHLGVNGELVWGKGASSPLLYGLSRLATAPPGELVFVVEGEGKVAVLESWGLVAVCSDCGATGSWPETFNAFFTGRTVIMLPDNDEPGEKYAAKVAASLLPFADCIKVLRLSGLPTKGDLLDWVKEQREAGHE